ncbi:MAG: UvrD-helicase domain-containing protein [Flavobacteriaceae bacterium]
MPIEKTKPFKIISASAGAGKTYTLVFHYLKDLLGKTKPYPFREMLALTFTNKAVHEMKFRILKVLAQLAKSPADHSMADSLCQALGLTQATLQERSALRLQQLLHDYGAFDVITIDSFNHRIVRTFAVDFKLPYGFEVVVHADEMLDTLIDTLIDKVGEDPLITQLLVDHSLHKLQEQKSWDVGIDLKDVTPLLMNENDRLPLKHLKTLSQEDFKEIDKHLKAQITQTLDTLRTLGRQTMALMHDKGLDEKDFNRGALYTYFKAYETIVLKDLAEVAKKYETKLGENLENGTQIYKKTTPKAHQQIIDELLPVFLSTFRILKAHVFKILTYQKLVDQGTPLSLLGQLENTLENLQQENQQMLLGRFNEMIASVVSKQPAPFIYERLGEKYMHYYIDEFQDTSQLQWKNLTPLVAHALEAQREGSDSGSLLLVGDAKQAIYRWRGGNVDQFLDLMSGRTPFQVEPAVEALPANYRSARQVISFNNRLFTYLGKQLHATEHSNLFAQATQQQIEENEGGVSITLIPEGKNLETRSEDYLAALVKQMWTCHKKGYLWSEMVVLVRQNKTAAQVAKALTKEEIPMVSSEALLLAQAPRVQGLMALIQLTLDPKNPLCRLRFFEMLWQEKAEQVAYYDFLQPYLEGSLHQAIQQFNRSFDTAFELLVFKSLPLYEAIEYALSTLGLVWSRDVYIQFFLETIHEFSHSRQPTWHHFERYWQHQQDRLSLQLSEALDAVQIMTIHKAKGLEFPVVFLPFLEADFQSSKDRIWAPIDDVSKLEWGWFTPSKKLPNYSEAIAEAYQQQCDAVQLDAANVLYVACTRAVEQLHLFTKYDTALPTKNYAALFHGFLEDEGKVPNHDTIFTWGVFDKPKREKTDPNRPQKPFEIHTGLGWQKRLLKQINHPENTESETTPRQLGILVHQLFAQIKYHHEVEKVLGSARETGQIIAEQYQSLKPLFKKVVQHPDLTHAFAEDAEVWIEQDLLLPDGVQLRPDRFVKTKDGITVIDFKTGKPHSEHQDQLTNYAAALSFMDMPIAHRYLVYVNENKVVVNEV